MSSAQPSFDRPAPWPAPVRRAATRAAAHRRAGLWALGLGLVLFLTLYNLTAYPRIWFDEGEHLRVSKALALYGVYADYSAEGFRYYGPSTSVGPTVMLPVAAVFTLFGIGLLQARLVMAAYLLATIGAYFALARLLGGTRLALLATALLVTSPGLALLEYGRQMLGEVPGLFFLTGGLALWFSAWERPGWGRLGLVGLLFGLASITKHQYALVLLPTLGLSWLANRVYYRLAPARLFLVPGALTALSIGLWQAYMILYMGPSTALENLELVRESVAAAVFVFSPELIGGGLRRLAGPRVFLGALPLALAYGLLVIRPRQGAAQRWGVLWILTLVNLFWYSFASVGWLRYAFPALALGSLFVARFFLDLIAGPRLDSETLANARRAGSAALGRLALRAALAVWLIAILAVSLPLQVRAILTPAPDFPGEMAAYLNQQVPLEALVETSEPELGFLTEHRYHLPPVSVLYAAVRHIWQGEPPPAESYDFVRTAEPEYVVVGAFGSWAGHYSATDLAADYERQTEIGPYQLFRRKDRGG
jgi:hypothetical protein